MMPETGTSSRLLMLLAFLVLSALVQCGGTTVINLGNNNEKPKNDTSLLFPDSASGEDNIVKDSVPAETTSDAQALDFTNDPKFDGPGLDQNTQDIADTFTPPDTDPKTDSTDLVNDIPVCIPGAKMCEDSTALECSPDGTKWTITDCTPLICYVGKCQACIPGERRCSGETVEECSTDGGSWTPLETCDFGTTGSMCINGKCMSPCEANDNPTGAAPTNVGCEYWAIDMDQSQEYEGHNSPYAIVVSNTHATLTASVTISNWQGTVKTVSAPPKTATIVDLDPYNIVGVLKEKLAWNVKSNLPIVAYQFNPLENVGVFSNDASLLLPSYALGTHYIVLAWPHRPGGALASNFAVVGTKPGMTKVTVRVSTATAPGGTVQAMQPGQDYVFDLEQFEVLNIESAEAYTDLSGSVITADQPVAVFAGHVCANAPYSHCANNTCPFDPDQNSCSSHGDCPIIGACDHLEEQLQAVRSWGQHYVMGKSWPRGKAPDFIRILAQESGTQVTLSPSVATVPELSAGQVYSFETTQNVEITATKPILVGQFLEGQDAPGHEHQFCEEFLFFSTCGAFGASCDTDADCSPDDANIGDPAFIIGVPVEQFRPEYVFLVPTKYAQNYITIVAPPDTAVTIDGASAGVAFESLPSGQFAVGRIPLPTGSHVLSADKPVGITVYGWDWYVSYGYPGGMNLKILN